MTSDSDQHPSAPEGDTRSADANLDVKPRGTLIGAPLVYPRPAAPPTPPPPPPAPPATPSAVAAALLKVGQRIAGRYIIQDHLGSGGMGVVYRALEEEIEREVAMKFIMTASLSEQDRNDLDERFRREAQALGGLPPHPNRVVLYYYGYDDGIGLNFICMEMVHGESLSTILARDGVKPSQIVPYACQIVNALVDVHAKGLVHRDLKPENVIVTRSLLGDEQLKLIDFGIARGLRRDGAAPLGQPEELVGTARYMAPELFSNGDDHPRADIYALGVLFYEMVAGRGPFDHLMTDVDDLSEVIRHHLDSEPEPLTSRESLELPPGFTGIILKCLAKRPQDRWSDASALLAAFDELNNPLDNRSRSSQEIRAHSIQARVWPIPQADVGPAIIATAISGASFLTAATDEDGNTWIWDYARGELVRAIPRLESSTTAPTRRARLGFSSDGNMLALGGRDGSLWICDMRSQNRPPRRLGEGSSPTAIAFDRTSNLLVISTEVGGLELWDVSVHKQLAALPISGTLGARGPSHIRSLAFSPDRRFLIAGTEMGLLFMWHFSNRSLSGALVASPPEDWPAQVENPQAVIYQDISEDGAFLAALRAGGVVDLWNPATKTLLGRIQLHSDESPRRLRFSPDNRQLIVAYDSGEIVVVDASSQAILDEVRIPRGSAVNISYTEDNTPVASTARGATVQVWDLLRVGKIQTLGPFTHHLLDVTFSAHGDRCLALSTGGHIDGWDLLSGRHLGRQRTAHLTVRRLDKAPEPGRVLLCGPDDGLVALEGLDVNNIAPLHTAPLPLPNPEDGATVQNYAISSDTRMVALGYHDGSVKVYSYHEPSDPVFLPGAGVPVTAIAFSPDNQMLAVASADGRLCLWDLPTTHIEWEDASEHWPIHFIAFNPSGRLLSVPRGNVIEIWNLERKRRVARLEGHNGPIRTMVHGLDGRLLLSSSDDRTARLWDLTQQRPLRILDDHPGPVTAATLGPDLRLLLTTSGPFLSIWRLSDAKLLARCVYLGGEEEHRWVTFTPEGHFIASHAQMPGLGITRPGSRMPLSEHERRQLFDPRAVALQLVTA